MIMMGITAAANMAVKPTTLYQAAMPLRVSAVISAKVLRLKIFLIIFGISIFIAQ
jgi:hypothetical protein